MDEKAQKIVVLTNGWVIVGTITGKRSLSNAKVIRKWGTSRGIGELANGPLIDTVTDPLGEVRIGKIVFSIPCTGW